MIKEWHKIFVFFLIFYQKLNLVITRFQNGWSRAWVSYYNIRTGRTRFNPLQEKIKKRVKKLKNEIFCGGLVNLQAPENFGHGVDRSDKILPRLHSPGEIPVTNQIPYIQFTCFSSDHSEKDPRFRY